jgi:SnoaL-like domain
MSLEKADVVRQLVVRWNGGDRDVANLDGHVDPAIELESPLAALGGEAYRGHAGLERWARELDDQFADWNIGLDEVRQIGNQVITLGTVRARGRASEVALQFPYASVFRFGSHDRIERICIYLDVNEALKAVGLAE